MEKRVFLAIFLSLVVLTVYQAVLGPPPRPTPAPEVTAPTVGITPAPGTTPVPGTPPATTPAGVPAVEGSGASTTAPAGIPLAAGQDVTVETDTIRAVFSTAGAVLTSWKLKDYRDGPDPLELVPTGLPANVPRPFAMTTDDPALSARLATAIYEASEKQLTLGSGAGTLRFTYRDPATGLNATKTFHFQPDGRLYVVRVDAAIDVSGAARPVAVHWGPALGAGVDPAGVFPRAIVMRGGEADRFDADDVRAQPLHEGVLNFAGVEDHYFLSVAVPGANTVRVEYQPIELPIPNHPEGAVRRYIAYTARTAGAASLPFFMGPKEFDTLRAVDPLLVDAIDFGMFAWLVVPLLQALKWVYQFLGNWGWSIVMLTVLINLVIFPLRHRSMVSMRKMQALQPDIKAIQERYAKYKITDPERQKMNQEMMALYKQKGVNPASGCVPLLLTMPVLFAFYAMLSVAIELRGAPFFGWIHDLSVADPYWVWPIVMGGTMFWQQRMTPTNADPVQQKIFLFLPLVFTVMFLAAPAGLVVYWLVSNLMAIGQQYLTNHLLGPPPRPVKAAALAPAKKPNDRPRA